MIIEIGDNLGFAMTVIGIVWALAYAFKAFHQNAER